MSVRPFISYAREDLGVARRLYKDLRSKGAEPWLDTEKLVGGQAWEPAITAAIRSSSHFLALISTNSISKRGYVQSELRQALKVLDMTPPGAIFLVPVRLDDTRPTHETLSALQWVDLWPEYEAGLESILKSLGLANSDQTVRELDAAASRTEASKDSRGFLTAHAVGILVLSRVQGQQRLAAEPFLLYQSETQKTWLVFTERIVACVLDDLRKNHLYDPLRWETRHRFARPVETETYKKLVGLLHLGPNHRDWLYSVRLHPDPDRLRTSIENLLLRLENPSVVVASPKVHRTMTQTLPERVRAALVERGITQRELAESMGISYSHLSRIQSGQAVPSLETVDRFARALGVSVTYLLSEPGAPDSARIRKK